jgi:hypothetical protein
MCRKHLFDVALVASAIVTGVVAWSGQPLALPLSMAFPMIWSLTRNRLMAGAVSAAYFLAASRGLPQGVAAYYGADLLPGLLLWLAASSGFVVIHALFWTTKSGVWPASRYGAIMLLLAVPPFGILGWAHPLTAAGIVFPAWGWTGLVAMAAGLVAMTTRLRLVASVTMTGLWLWSAINWTTFDRPTAWQGVDLLLGSSLGRKFDPGRHYLLVREAKAAGRSDRDVVVLPESAIGFWNPTVERLWVRALHGSGLRVLAGATAIDERGYDNVLVEISVDGGRIVYRQRMPVPGSMWQPWLVLTGEIGGAQAHFFANPITEVAGSRAAILICYELLIVWPIIQSMLYDPAEIVAVGNGWWTKGTIIVAIQRASAVAWSRLFAKPLVLSFNM